MGSKNRKAKGGKAKAAAAVPAAPPPKPEAEQEGQEDRFLLTETGGWPTVREIKKAMMAPLVLNHLPKNELYGLAFLVFSFALMLYGITAPREVALEDDGLFLMNLYHLGVGHPPGYPLYTLLGFPFFHALPDFLPYAYKGHMFSAFVGALACVAVFYIVSMLVASRICAVAAGMAYAASEAFWSQAIIAEVYTLNAALFFVVLAMCLRYASHTGPATVRLRVLYIGIALVYGLALSNHWPLMGLGSLGLLMIVLPQWRNIIQQAPWGALALAAGLLPYIWLILRSQMEHPINFYDGIDSLKSLWFYVTRSGYSGVDQQAGVGLEEKIAFTTYFGAQLAKQITVLGLGIAVVGAIAMYRSKLHRWLAVAFTVIWFMTGPLLIIMLDFQIEFIWFSAFRVYHLLSYGIVAIWFGFGLAWIGDWLRKKYSSGGVLEVAGGAALVIALNVSQHWHQNDRSDYTWARDLALFKLLQVEPNTKLFTFDDLDLPLGYLNLVEGVRPDVEVFNDQGLVFGKRIYSPFTNDAQKQRAITDYIELAKPNPIYYHPNRTVLFTDKNHYGSDFRGIWRSVNREGSNDRIVLSDALLYWLDNNIGASASINDRWTRQQAEGVVATLITAIYQAGQAGQQVGPQWEPVIHRAYEKNPLVHMYILWHNTLRNRLKEEDVDKELAWIDELVENSTDYILDNNNLADVMLLKANILFRFPDKAKVSIAEDYEQALLKGLNFEFKFSVFNALAGYYREQKRHDEAIALLDAHFTNISKAPLEFRELYDLLAKEKEAGRLFQSAIKLPQS